MIWRRRILASTLAVWSLGSGLARGSPGERGAAGDRNGRSQDLTAMSLEELTRVPVSSVARKDQEQSRVAAAVYVITSEEIRRAGLTTIPELLRRVPGIQVARVDASKWAVSARGFNGRFSNKMLVLIDGRSVYNNAYSGVYWDQNDVMVEDIERIEVIRGPGATMWGANAVNGVINIITKKARHTQGGLVVAEGGQDDRASTAVRYGGSRGDRMQYRAYLKGADRHAMLRPNGSGAGDGWTTARGGARLDWQPGDRDTLSFHGDLYKTRLNEFTNRTFPSPFQTDIQPSVSTGNGGYALGRWERTLKRSDIAFQGYYNAENRNEWIAEGQLRTMDLDFQQRFTSSRRHELVWGLGYRLLNDSVGSRNGPPFQPPSRTDHLFSTFVQDDFTPLKDKLTISAGTKIQRNSYTGLEVQPGVRILWTPNRRTTLWGSVSRAVRTPSRRDINLYLPFAITTAGPFPIYGLMQGNPEFQSEKVIAYEAGFRRQIGKTLFLDVASYVNRYRDLESSQVGSMFMVTTPRVALMAPLRFDNVYSAWSQGVETVLRWNAARRWRSYWTHSWQSANFQLQPGKQVPTEPFDTAWQTPRNTLAWNTQYDINSRLETDLTLYAVSPVRGYTVPGYVRLDARIAYKIGEGAELSAGVRNLQEAGHLEFLAQDYTTSSEIRRGFYVRFRYRF